MDKIDKLLSEIDKLKTGTYILDIEKLLKDGWTDEDIKELFRRNHENKKSDD